jgi:hypothetical protein
MVFAQAIAACGDMWRVQAGRSVALARGQR